jgi:hypothetical protein
VASGATLRKRTPVVSLCYPARPTRPYLTDRSSPDLYPQSSAPWRTNRGIATMLIAWLIA